MSDERFMEDNALDEQTSIVGGRRTDAEHIVERLGELGWTIGIAESLTGGEVCSQLVAVAGASRVVRGGIVAYATELKHRLLGVDALVLELGGPVQAKVARQMAEGVRDAVAVDGARRRVVLRAEQEESASIYGVPAARRDSTDGGVAQKTQSGKTSCATGAKLRRCSGVGPCSRNAARCRALP